MMTLEELLAAARKLGFANTDAIGSLSRQAIELRPQPSDAVAERGTRLGGRPLLPPSIPWPRHEERSLAFVAQLELAALPRVSIDPPLPSDGHLLFFYDSEQSAWGFDLKDVGRFAVIHVPATNSTVSLADWPAHLPEVSRHPPCALSPHETLTLPSWDTVAVEDLRLGWWRGRRYPDLLELVSPDEDTVERGLVGGHPDQIQGDMTLECALVSAGISCGDGDSRRDERFPVLRQRAHEWRLMLQVPSVDAAHVMWGDAGCLYYWIREEDLRARRFERSWMILQCC